MTSLILPILLAIDLNPVWDIATDLLGLHRDAPVVEVAPFDSTMPRNVMAWYFEGTDRIQVAPVVLSRDRTMPGLANLVVGHEMFHYLLDGIMPIEDHHCFFHTSGLQSRLAQRLVEAGLASHVILLPNPQTALSMGCKEIE